MQCDECAHKSCNILTAIRGYADILIEKNHLEGAAESVKLNKAINMMIEFIRAPKNPIIDDNPIDD